MIRNKIVSIWQSLIHTGIPQGSHHLSFIFERLSHGCESKIKTQVYEKHCIMSHNPSSYTELPFHWIGRQVNCYSWALMQGFRCSQASAGTGCSWGNHLLVFMALWALSRKWDSFRKSRHMVLGAQICEQEVTICPGHLEEHSSVTSSFLDT